MYLVPVYSNTYAAGPPGTKYGRARPVNLAGNAHKVRTGTQKGLRAGKDEKSEEIDIFIPKINCSY